jgi:hypothetical protein
MGSENGKWKLMPVNAAENVAMWLLNGHVDTQLGPAHSTFLMNKDKQKEPELIELLEKALTNGLQNATS